MHGQMKATPGTSLSGRLSSRFNAKEKNMRTKTSNPHRLYEQGLITEAEYGKKREEILATM